MKVAIGFFGQPRFYNSAHSHAILRKIIRKYDADVYCHAWWNETDVSIEGARRGIYEQVSDPRVGLEELYHPKQLVVEPGLCKKDVNGYTDDVFMQHGKDYRYTKRYPSSGEYLSAYLSQKRLHDMIDHTKYDWIIRWRYDLFPFTFPDLSTLDKDRFYVMINGGTEIGQPIFDDCGYILGSKFFGLLNVYQNLEEVMKTHTESFDPEWIHLSHAKLLGIADSVVKLPNDQFHGALVRSEQTFGQYGQYL
jgi:hypothetical protein